MTDGQKRRSPRYPVTLPVAFLDSKSGSTDHATVDVSRGGVFVRAEIPRPVRQLVRLSIALPTGEPVEVHGMVVHVISPEEAAARGGNPGMGVEFFGFGGDPRQRWEDFLRGLQSGAYQAVSASARPPSPLPDVAVETYSATPPPLTGAEQPVAPVASPAPQPPVAPVASPAPQSAFAPQVPFSGGASPAPQSPFAPGPSYLGAQGQGAAARGGVGGQKASLVCRVFPVPVRIVDELYEIYERELVTGSMFLCTPVQVPIGDRVVLRVIHPGNGESFDFHGLVQEVSTDPQYPGVTLALRPSTMARREKFRVFIERGLPEEDLSADLLDD